MECGVEAEPMLAWPLSAYYGLVLIWKEYGEDWEKGLVGVLLISFKVVQRQAGGNLNLWNSDKKHCSKKLLQSKG